MSIINPTFYYPQHQQREILQARHSPLASLQPVNTDTFVSRNKTVPNPLGVHVHFFNLKEGAPLISEADLNQIAAAGYKKVRMDILWGEVEKKPGQYDFSRYEPIINGLINRGIQPMVILGLGNPLYSKELTIQPKPVQEAFERYARATVDHFKYRGIIWELVNEPNHEYFWKPKPDVNEYMNLARRLLPRLKAIDPTGFIAAPSTAGMPLDFLKTCFEEGLLNFVDGVTIHPYMAFPSNKIPEKFEPKYQLVRWLVNEYQPEGKQIPLLLGEWGFSTATGELDEKTQADYLVRQNLLSLMYGAPANIWYDWKSDIDGGFDPNNKEYHFGIVAPNSEKKASYYAMAQLTQELNGMTFKKRLPSKPGDYLLVFSNGQNKKLVGWTIHQPHLSNIGNKNQIELTGTPKYLKY